MEAGPLTRLVEIPDDLDQFQEEALSRGWGDGLPLIPPTLERVEQMLKGTDRDANDLIAVLPPRYAKCTIESIAINAVLAGCQPKHLPVIISALEGIGDPSFLILSVQATTHPCGVMVLMNGPITQHVQAHAGAGVFGPGNRANATIGRAVRLILWNVGGAHPGETDKASQGSPAKYTFCFPENERDSPWQPYHVDLGFSPSESTVTVLAAEAPHNVNDHISDEPRGLMLTFAQTIATMGKNNAYLDAARNGQYFVAFGPEHAAILARHHWTKADVQQYLYERARIPHALWSRGGMFGMQGRPRWIDSADDMTQIPMSADAAGVKVVVVGGPGRHSSWIPSFGRGVSVTRLVRRADGSAWRPD